MLTVLDMKSRASEAGQVALSQYDGDHVIELLTERILPSQFYAARRNSEAIAPEQRLMLAVLEDAVYVHQRSARRRDARGRRLFRETDEWFASDETTSPFSFVTICQMFGLDPDYLRAGLRRWRDLHGTNGDAVSRANPVCIRRMSGSRTRITAARGPLRQAS
jgi:hypothetical protein